MKQEERDYYLSRTQAMNKDFDKNAVYWGRALARRNDQAIADQALRKARDQFAALIPEIPYIGGKQNPMLTNILVFGVQSLALYRVLGQHGYSADQVGEVILESFEEQIFGLNVLLRKIAPFFLFNRLVVRFLGKQALESQKKQYPEDWVYSLVKGDGRTFDYGFDYTECGLCKFLDARDAKELKPYMCLCDYPMSAALGWGLERTKTLAGGDDRCDFRFKKGRSEKWFQDPRRRVS